MDFKKLRTSFPNFEETKKTIEQTIENLPSDAKEYYWNSMQLYYDDLKEEIQKINAKNYNFTNKKISKRIEDRYNDTIKANFKLLNEAFPDLTQHTINLILQNTSVKNTTSFEFYLTSEINASAASIMKIGEDKIIAILDRNTVSLFKKDRSKYDAILLHEIAHIEQCDTEYLIKRDLFKNKFYSRSVVLYFRRLRYVLLILLLFFLYLTFDFLSEENPDMVTERLYSGSSKVVLKNVFQKLFIFLFPALFVAYQFKRNIGKKNRLLSEYGADVFSMARTQNFVLLDMLKSAQSESTSEIHWNHETRIDNLRSMMTFIYLANQR